ncbi:alpha/beta hydrolase [Bradyrhizobium sp. 190]|uniref:alpha/beta hydrolase family protein n=1 Tax=Bradyrhizobium sp. 190 TaxID=2782658 RepID=UPI001FF7F4EC|nr:alpha/beta hydrolase [Bradyrhizobium sp. 190]MCK1516088.1 alpha/beta hydrolase [Bradyrhizobium sp. 190]
MIRIAAFLGRVNARANWMQYAAWHQVSADLPSTRRGAALFLDNLQRESVHRASGRKNWVARWTRIGNAHCLRGDLNIRTGAFEEATEAWLCGLTAFEVARRLVDDGDPQVGAVSAKIEAGIQRLGLSLEQKAERVKIPCWDQFEFFAYYLPAGGSCAPAVICISKEEETGARLLGRLLPVVIGRGISVLVVSYDEISDRSYGQSEVLSCCLDYLSFRPEVDAGRIGVYGEGMSAVLATDFAASDRRVAAAVCDGGLWNWARILASVGWMAGAADVPEEEAVSARRSRLVRQLRCPVLVVAGGRGLVSVPEAVKLQADCAAASLDLQLSIPRMIETPVGEIENFVVSDDCIFEWLEQNLAHA